jgi:hypothetical protein
MKMLFLENTVSTKKNIMADLPSCRFALHSFGDYPSPSKNLISTNHNLPSLFGAGAQLLWKWRPETTQKKRGTIEFPKK